MGECSFVDLSAKGDRVTYAVFVSVLCPADCFESVGLQRRDFVGVDGDVDDFGGGCWLRVDDPFGLMYA